MASSITSPRGLCRVTPPREPRRRSTGRLSAATLPCQRRTPPGAWLCSPYPERVAPIMPILRVGAGTEPGRGTGAGPPGQLPHGGGCPPGLRRTRRGEPGVFVRGNALKGCCEKGGEPPSGVIPGPGTGGPRGEGPYPIFSRKLLFRIIRTTSPFSTSKMYSSPSSSSERTRLKV